MHVVGDDAGRQPVGSIVGNLQRFIVVFDLDDGGDGAKALLVENAHVRRHTLEHRGPVELLLVLGAAQHRRTFTDSVLDMPVDHGALRAADERADDRIGIARIADFQTFSNGDEAFAERIENRLLHKDARIRHADLALMEEDTESGSPDGIIDIRVGEHDEWAFAAHFERELLQ